MQKNDFFYPFRRPYRRSENPSIWSRVMVKLQFRIYLIWGYLHSNITNNSIVVLETMILLKVLVWCPWCEQFTKYAILGCLHSDIWNCSNVVLEKTVLKYFYMYISMLNYKPLLARQHLQGNHGFDSLESTLFENACIVISQFGAL